MPSHGPLFEKPEDYDPFEQVLGDESQQGQAFYNHLFKFRGRRHLLLFQKLIREAGLYALLLPRSNAAPRYGLRAKTLTFKAIKSLSA